MENLHELQAQAFDKLTVNERKAIDAMAMENAMNAIDQVLMAISSNIPACLIEPFPSEYREQNKYIQERIKQLIK